MVRLLQSTMLGIYSLVQKTGFLSTSFGRWLFYQAYTIYKVWLEAPHIQHLRPYIEAGSSVIDVGANIGFFTLKFADWVSNGGIVFAIEPEQNNFKTLSDAINRAGLEKQVQLVQAAASDQVRQLSLEIDLHHPANHRLSENGIPISGITLDSLLEKANWPAIGLIKIDVQGHEHQVLAGAQETLRRFHPALFIEVSTGDANEPGPETIYEELKSLGYGAYQLTRQGLSLPLSLEEVVAATKNIGYGDFLFVSNLSSG